MMVMIGRSKRGRCEGTSIPSEGSVVSGWYESLRSMRDIALRGDEEARARTPDAESEEALLPCTRESQLPNALARSQRLTRDTQREFTNTYAFACKDTMPGVPNGQVFHAWLCSLKLPSLEHSQASIGALLRQSESRLTTLCTSAGQHQRCSLVDFDRVIACE